jgi:nucleotide-binding universal stress UspA family protein
MPYRLVVVGTDGSESALKAVSLAAGLSAALGSRLLVVHAGTDPSIAEQSAGEAADFGARVETETRPGHPADVVIDVTAEKEGDLIVTGDKGMSHGKRVFMGGIPDRVAQHAPCDVLIVRTTRDTMPEAYERILIATDGSQTADRAARKGFALSGRLSARPMLVHVGHPKTGELLLNDTVKNIGGGVDADVHTVEGEPIEAIVHVVESEKADLLVVGNKGMTGARSLVLGSVPQGITHHAPCDVLVVRTATVFAAELPKGEGAIITTDDGRKVAAFRNDDGELVTLSAKCTHMGCTVGWNAFDKTWDCPCHGSRYRLDGTNFAGPAPRPLEPEEV